MYEDTGRIIVGELVWSFIAAIIGGVFGTMALAMNDASAVGFPGLLVGTFTFMILFVIKVIVWLVFQGKKHQDVLLTREDDRIDRANKQMKLYRKQHEAHSIEEEVKRQASRGEAPPININFQAGEVPAQPTNITPRPYGMTGGRQVP